MHQIMPRVFNYGTGIEARARIRVLALQLEALPKLNQVPVSTIPLVHHFAPHQYGREIHMPKGLVIVGKLHKHSHVNVISKGKCIVQTFEGEELLEAPATFVSPAGVQRAVYCLEDTVWTTLHSTDLTDLEEIEQEIIAKDYDDPALPVLIEQ